MLASTSYSVAQIASEVGYESEAAFNRAFKREFKVPPARFRSQSRSAQAKPPRPENSKPTEYVDSKTIVNPRGR
jgi:AraC-like DNA-binding protein